LADRCSDDEKHYQRGPILRLGDRKGVIRGQKKEIETERSKQRREQRRAAAEQTCRQQDDQQEREGRCRGVDLISKWKQDESRYRNCKDSQQIGDVPCHAAIGKDLHLLAGMYHLLAAVSNRV